MTTTALASALLQEDVEIEVIIVDDGSAASPPDHVDLHDPRVRRVRHTSSLGVAVARNSGVRDARGEWVAFLDDDDLWAPRKLRSQLDAAQAAKAGFAYSGAVWVDERLELDHGHAPPRADDLADALLRWNVLWGGASNVLARTDLVRSIGGFDEHLSQLADWDLWIRLAHASDAVAVDDVHVALVRHDESMLLVDRRDVFAELDMLATKHREAAERANVDVDRARFARWVATGHLRAGRRLEAARTFVRGTHEPGNVLRAAGALLGRRSMATASMVRGKARIGLGPDERVVVERPTWLDLYR